MDLRINRSSVYSLPKTKLSFGKSREEELKILIEVASKVAPKIKETGQTDRNFVSSSLDSLKDTPVWHNFDEVKKDRLTHDFSESGFFSDGDIWENVSKRAVEAVRNLAVLISGKGQLALREIAPERSRPDIVFIEELGHTPVNDTRKAYILGKGLAKSQQETEHAGHVSPDINNKKAKDKILNAIIDRFRG